MNFHPVNVDMELVSQRLEEDLGRPVTQIETMLWLRQCGFVPYGNEWLADDEALSRVDVLPPHGPRAD